MGRKNEMMYAVQISDLITKLYEAFIEEGMEKVA